MRTTQSLNSDHFPSPCAFHFLERGEEGFLWLWDETPPNTPPTPTPANGEVVATTGAMDEDDEEEEEEELMKEDNLS